MQPAEASAGTWSRVVRLIEAHPDVKQVRLNINEHSVTVGFYEAPSEETLNRIKTDVRAELSGQWDVSIKPDAKSPTVHLHKLDNYTTEFHRAHPADEPPAVPATGRARLPPYVAAGCDLWIQHACRFSP
jgi:hypothetical protein